MSLGMTGFWGVKGVPGVRLVGVEEGWRVLFDPFQGEEESPQYLEQSLCCRDLLQESGLSRQVFRTRREALEALEGLLAVSDTSF